MTKRDHDGDVLTLQILMSDEATQELDKYMESPISMVDANAKLTNGLVGSHSRLIACQLFCCTYYDLNQDRLEK